MTRSVIGVALLHFALLLLVPNSALAWGETGHRVVCQIAYAELQADARVEVGKRVIPDNDFTNRPLLPATTGCVLVQQAQHDVG